MPTGSCGLHLKSHLFPHSLYYLH